MKRWLAFVLALLLLPAVSGCGKKPAAPTKPPAPVPVKPAPIPAEPVEPTPVPAEPTPVPAEPVPQPEDKPPISALADRLAGAYRLAGSEQDGESTDIGILPLGGLLLVENADCWNGSVTSYWAQEIWPENAAVLQSTAIELRGVSLCFSNMSNDGEYWDAAMDVIAAPTEQGLTLTDTDGDYRADRNFVRVEDGALLHNDASVLYEILSQSAQAEGAALTQPDELVGAWCAADEDYAVWMSFGSDGALTYALKERGRPITVLFGAWGMDENDFIHVLAERFGYGTQPYDWLLVCSRGDDQLRLLDIGGYDNFPLPPVIEPYFVQAEENWCFPAELLWE